MIIWLFSYLPKLQSLKIGNKSFWKTTSLSLSSMIVKFDYFIFQIFLIYNHSKQEIYHSLKQQVYLCQVILFNYIIFSNLPNLQLLEIGERSFLKTTSFSLSSMIIKFNFIISNLPNLQSFETGDLSFPETTSLSLSSMII